MISQIIAEIIEKQVYLLAKKLENTKKAKEIALISSAIENLCKAIRY